MDPYTRLGRRIDKAMAPIVDKASMKMAELRTPGALSVAKTTSWIAKNDPFTLAMRFPKTTIGVGVGMGIVAIGRSMQRKRYEAPIAVQQAFARPGQASRYYQLQQGPGLRFSTRRPKAPAIF